MSVPPADAAPVTNALGAFLSARLGAEARFVEPPEPLGRGFDTYIYSFRLEADAHDPEWTKPLVLRLYSTRDRGPKVEREAAIQRFAAEHGYPALKPLVVEPVAKQFNLPLIIMDRVSGVTMLERAGLNLFRYGPLLARLGEAHAALHRLPLEGCPLPYEGPLVERQLADMRAQIGNAISGDLEEMLGWLERNKGAVLPEQPSIIHNDFHPLNVIVGDDDSLTVLDWSTADVGDPHHDIARTLVLFWYAPLIANGSVERFVLRLTRGLSASRYLKAYRTLQPVEDERVRYWQAFHAYQDAAALTVHQTRGGDAVAGVSERVERQVPPNMTETLRRYFWQRAW